MGSVADGALLDTSKLGRRDRDGDRARRRRQRDRRHEHGRRSWTRRSRRSASPTPAAGATYELGAQVLADYACADEPNGSGLDSCDGSVADGAAVDTGSLGQKTFTVNASDHAGNTESKSVSYTVVDTKAPSIVVTTPAPGAVYGVGEQVAADYSCSDDGSGVASCVGSVADRRAARHRLAGREDLHGERHRQGRQPGLEERQLLGRRPDARRASPSRTRPMARCTRSARRCSPATAAPTRRTAPAWPPARGRCRSAPSSTPRAWARRRSRCAPATGPGNAGSRTVSYSVVYDFDGFLWPLVNPPRVNRWKAGLPVPVRFSLGSYRGSCPWPPATRRSRPCPAERERQAAGTEKARGPGRSLGARVQARPLDLHVPLEDREELGGRLPPARAEADDGTVHRVEVRFVGRGTTATGTATGTTIGDDGHDAQGARREHARRPV